MAPRNSTHRHIAVCFSGWLGVSVPRRGLTSRRHLVDVLKADVFVAGTWLPTDCGTESSPMPQRVRTGDGNALHDDMKACLLRRIQGLQPLTATRLDRMLSVPEIRSRIERSPHWQWVSAHFDASRFHDGISVWSPLLGNGNLSVVRARYSLG